MAMSKSEILEWLNGLEGDPEIGVDEGGLILLVVGNDEAYCEIGGLPEEEEDRRSEAGVRF